MAGHRLDLGDNMFRIFGRQEPSLLHVHRTAGGGSSTQETRLTRQEGWNLQDIQHLGRNRDLGSLVDVRQDRHADLIAHAL